MGPPEYALEVAEAVRRNRLHATTLVAMHTDRTPCLQRTRAARSPLSRQPVCGFLERAAKHSVPAPQITPRPPGITALGAFFACGTLAGGLAVVSLLAPGSSLEPLWRLNPRAREAFAGMGTWAPLLLGTVCLACAASAYGFFRGKRWGYRLGVALLLVNLTGDLVNAALGIEPRALVGVPIVALLLWYLSSSRVRTFFMPAARGAA